MKKSEIKPALDALKEIKMPKIEDKPLRNDLIENHYVLYDEGKKLDAEVEKLREVHLGAFKEEQQKVSDLQQKLQGAETPAEQRDLIRQINSFEAWHKAVKLFNDAVNELYKGEVNGLKAIDRKKLTEELEKQDIKLSWIEALYPLFNL